MEQKISSCTSVTPGEPQLTIGREKFTFDSVFDQLTPQKAIYEKCVKELVEGAFEGYNATVFAYGQTGSGKTYTMGTSLDTDPADRGIIPSAAQQIFDEIEQRREHARSSGKELPTFEVSAQFIELYNEELVDLLSSGRDSSAIKIKEDPVHHDIFLQGVSSRNVTSHVDILSALATGAQNRTTAATNMNKQSSRSHAIFTLCIKQTRVASVEDDSEENNTADDDEGSAENMAMGTELETLNAKFHFVDLAGSERLSRTGATGDRAKESISINSGLLALGNVISALGGAKGRVGHVHVPYRDSKLTRLLQDSLGGNSRTVMITCVSPNEADYIETLNSLNYANRAKKIKNKIFANQNKPSTVITELKVEVQMLKAELSDCKAELHEWQTGKRGTSVSREVKENDGGDFTKQIAKLTRELESIKKQKVDLVRRQRDENRNFREAMLINSKKLVTCEKLLRQQEAKIQKLELTVSHQSELLKRKMEENQRMRKKAIEWTSTTKQMELVKRKLEGIQKLNRKERRRTMFEVQKRRPLAPINEQRTPPEKKHVERLNTTYIVETPTVEQNGKLLGQFPEEEESNYELPPLLSDRKK